MSAASSGVIIVRYATWPVHRIDPGDIVAASELEKRHRLSFWDALVIVSAPRERARRSWRPRICSTDAASASLIVLDPFRTEKVSA